MRARTSLLLTLVVAIVLFAPGLARGDGPPPPPARRVLYTVEPGDTLWDIAGRFAPGQDPRLVVRRIVADNHLQGPLQPGQELVVADG